MKTNYARGEAHAALRARNYSRLTAILKAVVHVDAQGHTALIDNENIHIFNLAAKLGDLEALRLCIKAGYSLNVAYNGFYPLHSAALHGHAKACSLLVSYKANVNLVGQQGKTALMAAVVSQSKETILVLHRAGANINARAGDGYTSALAIAISLQSAAVVELLLKLGADFAVRNHLGLTLRQDTERLLAKNKETRGSRENFQQCLNLLYAAERKDDLLTEELASILAQEFQLQPEVSRQKALEQA